jgi:tetratricopeptide (TPR) repeat protein
MMEPQRGKAIAEMAAQNVRPAEDVPITNSRTFEIILGFDLLIGLGRFEEARQDLSLATEDNTPPEGLNWIAVCKAELAAHTGEDSTFDFFTPSFEALLEHHGSRQHLYRGRRALGVAHASRGEYDRARERLNQAQDGFLALDTPWQQGRTLLELGKLERAAGDEAAAQVHFQNALSLFEGMKARFHAEQTRALSLATE